MFQINAVVLFNYEFLKSIMIYNYKAAHLF